MGGMIAACLPGFIYMYILTKYTEISLSNHRLPLPPLGLHHVFCLPSCRRLHVIARKNLKTASAVHKECTSQTIIQGVRINY